MTLQNDLLKHTIFLQRFATTEQAKLIENIKRISDEALLHAHNYTTLRERKKRVTAVSKELQTQSTPLEGLYDYERKFIRRLLRKYGNKDSIK